MILSYLKQLNWLDIFAVILLIRIGYIAVKTGFTTEIFKLLGTIFAIFLAGHYYIRLGIFLSSFISIKEQAGINFLNFLVFILLVFLGYFVFAIIRRAFTILIKMEAVSLLNRWGAVILGIVRWSLFISLLFLIISISNINYLKDSLLGSLSGPKLIRIAPGVYASIWNNLMSRFMDKKVFNKELLEFSSNFKK